MGKFGKVLLAYDGSEASVNALDQAVVLVRAEEGAELIIVVVMHMPEAGVEMISMNDARAAVEEGGARMAGEAEARARKLGVEVSCVVRQGTPYEEITNLAEEVEADVIVTGRRGMTRFERAMIGSVTSRVIGHSSTDVLVIPGDGKILFDSVLAATDGSDYGELAVGKAIDFATSYGAASVTFVTALDENEEFTALAPEMVDRITDRYKEALERARESAKEAGLEASVVLKRGRSADVINISAREAGAKIVFVGTHGRSALGRLLMGSVTERVIGTSKVPVLVTKKR